MSDVCGVLAHYLQNWLRCFYTLRRQSEAELFIRPVMDRFVKEYILD